jgi:acyl carrier protein
MNRGDLRAQLFALLREHVDGEVQLSAATTVCGELGLSSVELMELTAKIEDRFGVRLPDQLLPELLTVGDMLRAVELRLEARGALAG